MSVRIKTVILFFAVIGGLYAQTEFPAGDFWALDAGFGMSGILVNGQSYQGILEPKLWLSPPLMVGSKVGVNYSTESDSKDSNILTFEGQVFLRWNVLRLGHKDTRKIDIFAQIGLGLIAAYRGDKNPLDNVTMTRGSLLGDGALGVTIPLGDRFHVEPSIHGGYPHIAGFSVTAGYKIPLPRKVKYYTERDYTEIIKTLPPEVIIKRLMVTSVEFILFGPDIGNYNVGIDRDARDLNDMVLNSLAQQLKDNPNLRVRLEGHANPFTINPSEADELMALGSMRSNNVAAQLRSRGVNDDQMIIISYGGTRVITTAFNIRERNRRVELIIIDIDTDND